MPESRLIEACATGDREAWTCVITRYQPGVEAFVWSLLLRRGIKDQNIVSELLSNLWSEQMGGKRFATYDAKRGTLRKYLCGLARKHVLRWLHNRAWATRHERQAMRQKPEGVTDGDGSLAVLLADFLDQASPRELAYIRQELLRDWPARQVKPFSDANKRQLHHRAERRLRRLLGIHANRATGRSGGGARLAVSRQTEKVTPEIHTQVVTRRD
jgi:hypothetical protein